MAFYKHAMQRSYVAIMRYYLPRNILEQNKQVQKMYVMDKYFVKQPQNIIIKVKMKEHKIGKKDYIYTGKKLNEIYIIAFIFL